MSIDWTNSKDKVSKYFTVHECLWLPQWNRLANEIDGLDEIVKSNLLTLCAKMDTLREYFAKPINVHCCYRPEAYNQLVGGAKNSAHKYGQAIDFDVSSDCDATRAKLIKDNMLEKLQLRMEDLLHSSWVHLDTRAPSDPTHRFFKP